MVRWEVMERILRKTLRGGRFSDVSPKHSATMSRIRSKGNKTTEARLRAALVRSGIRGWKLHPKDVFGSPDFYFEKERLAIFVDGCFWHGCPRCGHTPRVRTAFWRTKFERNQIRAKVVRRRLRAAGIRAIRLWEHDLLDLPTSTWRITRLLQGGAGHNALK